ncbi:MAG: NADH-quinone oxidoreductase subunit L, partial [Thermoleophilaceae bacterium]|nr:NADH-quinone oxidoreductase subunit L [Thermoleophilaceae bacterium]
TVSLGTWMHVESFRVDWALRYDTLAAVMVAMVTFVATLIHIYSVGYMSHDATIPRFFSYLSLFTFAMLMLVTADNLVQLFFGWEGVGLASYLLIGYWYDRPSANRAAMKAFIVNRVGDLFFAVGIALVFLLFGSVEFTEIFARVHEHAGDSYRLFGTTWRAYEVVGLLLFLGAMGKSAQLGLHTWLPDAMEGPTPVSALIHAATMVTAGVYLIARTHPLFELAPAAADVGAIIGTATLVFAATVALAVTDLKRTIAYSTISQIGYMVLGVSVFAYGAGLFHLMTHAFFKALLFMGAGSVISAMGGIQDMDRMGGFRKAMPFTFAAFTAGALALAAFPFTSGFFSKDEILAFTVERGGWYVVLAIAGYAGAALTAFYAFRMVFRVFYGNPVEEARELEQGHLAHHPPANPATGEPEDTGVGFPAEEHHIAERELPMRAAMGPLAVLALLAGLVQVPGVSDVIENFLEPTFEDSRFHEAAPSDGSEWVGLGLGGLIALAGISAAYYAYVRRRGVTLELRDRFPRAHAFLINKWYFDELFEALFVRPVATAGAFGRAVVETRFVQGFIVGGATGAVRVGSSFARAIQTGYLRAYALLLMLGVALLALYFLLASS